MDGIRMRMYYSGSASENIYPNPNHRLTKDFRPKGIRIMYGTVGSFLVQTTVNTIKT